MSHGLPEDWYEEHDGQMLVLDSAKVAAEIERLRKAIGDYLTSGNDRSAILALQRALEQNVRKEG